LRTVANNSHDDNYALALSFMISKISSADQLQKIQAVSSYRRNSLPISIKDAMPARVAKLSPLEQWVTNAAPGQLHAVSGAAGGFASGVVTCPLDVIKVRLQSQGSLVPVRVGPLRLNLLGAVKRSRSHHGIYKGFIHTARLIWREEGVRGMYRGMGPLLLGYLPTWGIYFTVYQQSKTRLPEHNCVY
jgi:solute carrier family 25 folate transporter 32